MCWLKKAFCTDCMIKLTSIKKDTNLRLQEICEPVKEPAVRVQLSPIACFSCVDNLKGWIAVQTSMLLVPASQ